MGIPSYFSYIVRQNPKLLKRLDSMQLDKTRKVDHFYIDANSIIYDVVRNGANTNSTIYSGVALIIKKYYKLINPSQTLGVMFDGVAPVAKMAQQKIRRFKGAIEKEIINNSESANWDTTAITPGTIFMQGIGNALKKELSNLKVNVIISGPEERGEGEHKIYARIRQTPELHKTANTVIYGLDADLIMLTLNHLHIAPTTYLFRETPHFAQSLNTQLIPNANYVLDIPELALAIAHDFGSTHSTTLQINTQLQKQYVSDYILLCFFLGNDFMPHFPALNIRTTGMNTLIDAYKHVISNEGYITNGERICWKNIRKLVTYLATKEEELIRTEHISRRTFAKRVQFLPVIKDASPLSNLPLIDRRIEEYIEPTKEGWQKRYYAILFDIEPDKMRRKQICQNYLEALEWTYKYYTGGCIDWRWSYKYDYPPLLSDLVQYIPYLDVNVLSPSRNANTSVDPYVQLAYVLPAQSLSLLPDTIVKRLVSKHPNWYKSDYDFVWAYCRYFWEAHVKFPEINIECLHTTITSE